MRASPSISWIICLTLSACAGSSGDGKSGGPPAGGSVDEDSDGFFSDEDCDDADPGVNPGASEVCDGLDNDCDGLVDDEDDSLDPSTTTTFFVDGDGDGLGNPDEPSSACAAGDGFVSDNTDCDDTDPDFDRSTAMPYYIDGDTDGFGDPDTRVETCVQPDGTVLDGTDCDDDNLDVNPDAPEVCNGIDDDCDGAVDDEDSDVDLSAGSVWYTDSDGDGYGDSEGAVLACAQPSGTVDDNTDCDDTEASANPGATEWIGDGIDNDCDDSTDDLLAGGEFDPSVAAATVSGTGAFDSVGSILVSGDFDGDGVPDLMLGAGSSGTAYAMFGPVTSDVTVATADATFTGLELGVGDSLAAADVDGDGYDDLWGGGATVSPGGFAYLVHGPFTGSSAIDAVADATLSPASGSPWLGYTVEIADDLSGDGRADIVVGAPLDRTLAPAGGAVHLFPADQSGASSTASATASITGAASYDQLGGSLSSGDVNGDGVNDLVIGGSTNTNGGDVYAFYGPVSGAQTNASADLTLVGGGSDLFARSVASGFDHDGDGYDDIIVGAAYDGAGGSGAGAAYVFGGSAATGSFDKSTYQARVLGSAGDYVGFEVFGVEDFDGDGLGDVWVSTYNGATNGAASMFVGPVSGALTTGDAFVHIDSNYQARHIGSSFTEIADIDGDGRPEFWLGAPGESTTASTAGKAFLVRSSDM